MDLVVVLPWGGLLLLLGPQILSRYRTIHPCTHVLPVVCKGCEVSLVNPLLRGGIHRTCSLGQGCKIPNSDSGQALSPPSAVLPSRSIGRSKKRRWCR